MQMGTGIAGIDRLLGAQDAQVPGTAPGGPMITPGPFSAGGGLDPLTGQDRSILASHPHDSTGGMIGAGLGAIGSIMAGSMIPGGSLLLKGLNGAMAPAPVDLRSPRPMQGQQQNPQLQQTALLNFLRQRMSIGGGGGGLQSLILNLLRQRQQQQPPPGPMMHPLAGMRG